jgi:hypothetical protein
MYVEHFEAEVLDALDEAIEGGGVSSWSTDDRVIGSERHVDVVEGSLHCRTGYATDRDHVLFVALVRVHQAEDKTSTG